MNKWMQSVNLPLVLVLMLLGLQLMLMPHGYAEGFPAPPKSVVSQVSPQTSTLGMTLSIRRFESRLTVSEVLDFYRKYWNDESVESLLPPWEMRVMVKNQRLYNVQVQAQGSGSWGYLSISNLPEQIESEVDKKAPALPKLKHFAAMQGTQLINQQTHDDGFKSSRVLWLSNQFSVNSNSQFYLQHFQNQGWQLLSDTKTSRLKPRVLALQKGRKNISMTISKDQGATQIIAVEETAGLLGL